MKRYLLCLSSLACVAAAGAALAQTPSAPQAAAPAKTAPAVAPATADTVIAPAPVVGFPALPPSRPCKKEDVAGFWKLSNVYERPAGQELLNFNAQPYQYLLFSADSTYKETRVGYGSIPDAEAYQKLQAEQSNALLQFVVSEGGLIYFYKERAHDYTMACFIVANGKDPFVVGDILLMPPADPTRTSRLLKVFKKTAVVVIQQNASAAKAPTSDTPPNPTVNPATTQSANPQLVPGKATQSAGIATNGQSVAQLLMDLKKMPPNETKLKPTGPASAKTKTSRLPVP
ncbi:MAG: hypothetical protein SFT92_07305 [Rickettsiales bacterium]|nr:hypothetical protein [Rickettsiales bacterium]